MSKLTVLLKLAIIFNPVQEQRRMKVLLNFETLSCRQHKYQSSLYLKIDEMFLVINHFLTISRLNFGRTIFLDALSKRRNLVCFLLNHFTLPYLATL